MEISNNTQKNMNVKHRTMNQLYTMLAIIFLFGCQGNQDIPKAEEESTYDAPEQQEAENPVPQFESIADLFADAGDYREENGTLKIISSGPELPHVQVSPQIVKGDQGSVISNLVRQDAVYVTYQLFAQTSFEKIKVTVVPLRLKDDFTFDKYVDAYEKSFEVDRSNALEIMRSNSNAKNFGDLYELNGTIWVPSAKFNLLKGKNVKKVFRELRK